LTGERTGYYEDFAAYELLGKASREVWVYDGVWSRHRQKTRGRQPTDHPRHAFVVAAQNHDHVGNRAFGDRLPPVAHGVALACVLFALETPLIFMGEEYDEQNPFQFFTDHIDPAIAEATREGRRAEVDRTSGAGGEAPDPQAVETFERSKLDQREPESLFRELLALRPKLPRTLDVSVDGKRVTLTRGPATLELDFDAKTARLRDRRRLDGAGQGAQAPAPPAPERE